MVKLTDVPGIGPASAKLLAEHEIKTVAALAAISLAELKKISGFNGDVRAQAVKKAAADCLKKTEIHQNRTATDKTAAAGEIKNIKKDKNSDSKTKEKKEKSTKKNEKEKKKKKHKKSKKDKKNK